MKNSTLELSFVDKFEKISNKEELTSIIGGKSSKTYSDGRNTGRALGYLAVKLGIWLLEHPE